MNCCYIIYSHTLDKYYVGACHDDLTARIRKHIDGHYGARFTSQSKDWQLFHFIECEAYSHAVNLERHIKKMKSRTYIENLKKYPEMTRKLWQKYSKKSSELPR